VSATAIVDALGGKRGRAACPVCQADGRDRGGDHLAVRDDGGRVLVHCFAGCEQRAVIDALRALGLWPGTDRRAFTATERQRYAAAKSAAAGDARRCWHWRIGAVERLNSEKRRAVDCAAGRFDAAALEEAARAARVIEGGGPGAEIGRAHV